MPIFHVHSQSTVTTIDLGTQMTLKLLHVTDSVYSPQVSSQVSFFTEKLATHVTLRSSPVVIASHGVELGYVVRQATLPAYNQPAHVALKLTDANTMHTSHMLLQLRCLREHLTTSITSVRLKVTNTMHNRHVLLTICFSSKRLRANIAFERSAYAMSNSQMCS